MLRRTNSTISKTAWAEDFSPGQLKGIGTLEILAAVGLVVPAAIDVATFLTPTAAVGVVLLMVGAGATHLRRGETSNVAMNAALALVAVFIAIERFGPHSL